MENKSGIFNNKQRIIIDMHIFILTLVLLILNFYLMDKTYDKKIYYCSYSKNHNYDINCINDECLLSHSLSIDEYNNCQLNTTCWNNGDNIFVDTCFSQKCSNYNFLCSEYKKFYDNTNYNSYNIYFNRHHGQLIRILLIIMLILLFGELLIISTYYINVINICDDE